MTAHKQHSQVDEKHMLQLAMESLERSPECVFWVTPDARLIYVNDSACRILGYSREEMLSMRIFDIDADKYPQMWLEHWEQIVQDGLIVFESRYRKRDGELIPVEIVVSHITLNGVECACMFARDINERKRADDEIRASEELLSLFVENVPVDVEMFDNQMRYILTSRKFRTDYGFENENLIGRSHYEVFPESIKWKDVHDRCLAGAVESNEEDSIVWPDGHVDWLRWEVIPWHDKNGNIGGIMIFSQLITERKKAEMVLRASEEKHRFLVERINDWLWEVDENCCYTYASPKIRDLLGYEPEEVLGKTCFDFMTPEEAERVKSIFIPIAQRKEPFSLLENTVISKSGEFVVMESSGEPVFDEDGEFRGYRGIDRDITASKRAQELNTALNTINTVINSTLDYDSIIQRVLVEAARALRSESSGMVMREEGAWVIKYVNKYSEEVVGDRYGDDRVPQLVQAVTTGEPVALEDVFNDPEVNREIVQTYGIQSILIVPLIVRGEPAGVMVFAYHTHQAHFTASQIDSARKLATATSLALENARLYAAERAAAEREAAARQMIQLQFSLLQRALIPSKPSVGEGYRTADIYIPVSVGQDIGGDFYDVFKTEQGKVGILIGDVAGKSIEAAALAAAARSTVRAFTYEIPDAGQALTQANSVLCAQQPASDIFVTLFLAILDPTDGTFQFASAGHPPSMIWRKDGSIETLLCSHAPVGILEGQQFRNCHSWLGPGDKLVCYTDGISEARRDHNFFDTDGVLRTLMSCGSMHADVIAQALINAAKDWSHDHLTDDVAVLVVERE